MAELELIKESVVYYEALSDLFSEQPVELDYLLPDRCPDMVTILKTEATPVLTEKKISGDKLYLDGSAEIDVYYLSEDPGVLCKVSQSLPFSRVIDLPGGDEKKVYAEAKTEFIGARAVTPRRLDIRGGIRFTVKVDVKKTFSSLSDATGNGIRLRSTPLTLLEPLPTSEKTFSVTDDCIFPDSLSPYGETLFHRAQMLVTDQKILNGKAVIKGEILYHLCYRSADGKSIEKVDFSIPVSQILDISGANEDTLLNVFGEVTRITVEEKEEKDRTKGLFTEFSVRLTAEAFQSRSILYVTDSFSTRYLLEPVTETFSLRKVVAPVNIVSVPRLKADISGQNMVRVEDISLSLTDGTLEKDDAGLVYRLSAAATIFGRDENGNACMIERLLPFTISLNETAANPYFAPALRIRSVAFTFLGDESIELQPEIHLSGILCDAPKITMVTGLTVTGEKERPQSDVALRLYKGEKGEDVWEIAKRFSTSPAAIREENELTDEVLLEEMTLLIPIVED